MIKNNLTKSTMKLVNQDEFTKILSPLEIEDTVAGGSVANSVVGLSQLGNKVGFIGKISDDELGSCYIVFLLITLTLAKQITSPSFSAIMKFKSNNPH